MAEEQLNTETPVREGRKRSPVFAFLDHQRAALEETGKALVSLLPRDFREHTGKALDEGRAGWSVLVDGVIDEVQHGLDKLRTKSAEEESGAKTRIDVE